MASCPCRHPTTALQAGCSSLQLRWCCRRAVLSCSSDGAAAIPKSGPEIQNHCTLEVVSGQKPAAIPKSGPEIKNQCTQEGVNREKLASIRKSEPEIKNRCTLEGINRQNLASIPKFDPEIKNRCSRGVVAFCRRNHSPLPLRKLESDAALVAATTTAGGPFFSAAKKIRIRRGDSLQKAAHPQTIPQHAFHHALTTRLALDVLHGAGSTQVRQWRLKRVLMRPEAAFPYVFAAEGAQHPPKSRHVQRSAATKTNTKNSIFVNPGLTLGRVPKMRSRKGI